jgi:FixJ family two-component response regulator
MVMPGKISGRALAQTLQSQKGTLKIIYTTGYSVDAINMEQVLDEGRNFLAKPYTLEKLALTVRRRLDGEPSDPPAAPVGSVRAA